MNGIDEKITDIAAYKKLKEIETSLKDEMALRNKEIIDLMNKRDEYLTHMLRVVLGKIDSMDTTSENIVKSLCRVVEKKKRPRRFPGFRNISWARLLNL